MGTSHPCPGRFGSPESPSWVPSRAPFRWADVEDEADRGRLELHVSLAPPRFGEFLAAARRIPRRGALGSFVGLATVRPVPRQEALWQILLEASQLEAAVKRRVASSAGSSVGCVGGSRSGGGLLLADDVPSEAPMPPVSACPGGERPPLWTGPAGAVGLGVGPRPTPPGVGPTTARGATGRSHSLGPAH